MPKPMVDETTPGAVTLMAPLAEAVAEALELPLAAEAAAEVLEALAAAVAGVVVAAAAGVETAAAEEATPSI